MGLEERAHHLRLGKYSKGMLQRVGLAQALIHSPQLLVLDEPSDGVTGRPQTHSRRSAGARQKGVTVFLNSHLLAEVELFCREVAIIQRGKLALTGTVEELTSGSGYRVEAVNVPEHLADGTERARAQCIGSANGSLALCSQRAKTPTRPSICCAPTSAKSKRWRARRSTLEEVFIRTVEVPAGSR